MPSPILARADALMQRRRNQNADFDDIPVLTDAVDADDDFPILNDVDTLPAAFEAETEVHDEPAAEFVEQAISLASLDAGMRDILAHELARRVEQRLATELPRIIESTVRDFLAEHEMISALQARD